MLTTWYLWSIVEDNWVLSLPINQEKNKLNPGRMKSLFYTNKKSGNFVDQYCRSIYKWDVFYMATTKMQIIKDYISSKDSDVAFTWISCGLFFNISIFAFFSSCSCHQLIEICCLPKYYFNLKHDSSNVELRDQS